jgi:hypothetical protein
VEHNEGVDHLVNGNQQVIQGDLLWDFRKSRKRSTATLARFITF